jgi:transposase
MLLDLDNLPSPALLHRLVHDMAAMVEHRNGEIERLQLIIRQLQRAQYGRRSEQLDPDQLALGLGDLNADLAAAEGEQVCAAIATDETSDSQPKRKPLPDHLAREEVVLDVTETTCPCCGGALHPIGESVSERLDWVPARVRVIRTRRPKYACRSAKRSIKRRRPSVRAPAAWRRRRCSPMCLSARHGVELERSTLAGWVGGACWWLDALHERLCKDVFASDHLFADDTPVPVFDPGRGRTKTGRLWVYARDQRGWGGPAPPTAVFLSRPTEKLSARYRTSSTSKASRMSMATPVREADRERRRRLRRMLGTHTSQVLRDRRGGRRTAGVGSAAPDQPALRC